MANPLLKQVFLSLIGWLQMWTVAFMYGVQSIMFPSLRAPESKPKVTMEQATWIPSIMLLMGCPASLLAGCLTPKYGRKRICLLYSIPSIVGAILIFYAEDFQTLFVGFLCIGLMTGSKYITNIYIAECCSPRLRGTMLDIKYFFVFLGFAVARLLGNAGCDWRNLALYSIIFPTLSFIFCLFCPESPAWLATQGRFEESRKAYIWLRGHKEGEEINQLIELQDRILKTKAIKKKNNKINLKEVVKFLIDKNFLKANSIALCCAIFYDSCGKHIIATYIDAVNAITNDPKNLSYYTFALDITDCVALCVSTITVTVVRRRRLLFAVGVPAVIWVLCFSAVSYVSYLKLLPDYLSWLPFGMFLVYTFMMSVSALPIINTIQGEIYPLSHRGAGIVCNCIIFVFTVFTVTKTGLYMIKSFSVHGTFFINSIIMSLALLYLYFMMPETFNRTLQSIEEELDKSKMEEIISVNPEYKQKMLSEITV